SIQMNLKEALNNYSPRKYSSISSEFFPNQAKLVKIRILTSTSRHPPSGRKLLHLSPSQPRVLHISHPAFQHHVLDCSFHRSINMSTSPPPPPGPPPLPPKPTPCTLYAPHQVLLTNAARRWESTFA